jgi:hypothetical protein
MSDEIKNELAELYPQLSDKDQSEVEEVLRRYLSLVKRIYEHVVVHDPKTLTELRRLARLRKKGEKSA